MPDEVEKKQAHPPRRMSLMISYSVKARP